MTNYSHLWNDLPIEERKRLHPFLLSVEIREAERSRDLVIEHHERYLGHVQGRIDKMKNALADAANHPKDEA